MKNTMKKPTINDDVLKTMSDARTAVIKMRSAMRDADMTDERAKQLNRIVRDMIELIAQFEDDSQPSKK